MHILIVVWFRAPFGGLHSNTRQTADMLMKRGHDVTLVCPPGPFAKQMQAAGAQTIETDFNNHGALLEYLAPLSFDIIHAHPGLARMFARKVAAGSKIPLFITFHGAWLDGIENYWQETTAILAVSPAIVDEILMRCPGAEGRVHLIPNATCVLPEDAEDLPGDSAGSGQKSGFNIVVASRLDGDKLQLVEFLIDILNVQATAGSTQFHWHFAGDGTELPRLREAAAQTACAGAKDGATFHGWLPEEQLGDLNRMADFAVAPGRSAIDALGMAIPTVAVGSAGCFGVVTPENYAAAAHCNFGGFGLTEGATAQAVFDDLTALAEDPARLAPLGRQLQDLVQANHNQSVWDDRLMTLYRASLDRTDLERSDAERAGGTPAATGGDAI